MPETPRSLSDLARDVLECETAHQNAKSNELAARYSLRDAVRVLQVAAAEKMPLEPTPDAPEPAAPPAVPPAP